MQSTPVRSSHERNSAAGVGALFMALARTNPEAILVKMGPDIAIVDQTSRPWLRGTTGLSRRLKDLHAQLLV